ncbi:LysR family transcriptional regulator ArgP [Acinetobacter sp. ANC 5579]|uniref:LysR family transcriptional regulator ArgP n=1 Tax=Acinetobacter TaxID=469 RepID=UPI000991A652|nr:MULTISPECIES: LysR family transcriptional regulator ArgP [Acinetobacter]MCL6230510.1 LysR family transcriptional regulator ArgP [Acinetobacter amyesii]MCL6234981.1 LysR family transcriptional regulator ArgP [Acinetobacter amyesii]OOV83930.1 transcriptional regulator ArgP [Acinetobacter sp. ANC 5600]UUS66116.1 LysR family transcriptional regulator ArgP [Acinetobacter sp. YH12068_T]
MLQSKHSEAFLAVAETGSFEQAALRLNITASAVTLRLQTLEKKLGHVLIVRERPCRPTLAGQSLLHYLQHSKLLEHNFLQNLTGQTANAFYQVNIATNADSLATWLLPLLKDLLIEEKIVIHFQVDDQSQTHHLLEAGLVNACVTTESEAMKGCIAEYLGEMHYRFVATPDFIQRWFGQGVTRNALRAAPALIFNEKDDLHTQSIQKNFGLNPSQYPHHFIPSSTAFFDAITMGLGYGWLPDYQSKDLLAAGKLIELSTELSIDLALYWHHWNQQSIQLQKITAVMLQHAKDHMC